VAQAAPHMQKSNVVDSKTGKSVESSIRTSYGTFLTRGQDQVVKTIEQRIAAFSMIPYGVFPLLPPSSPLCSPLLPEGPVCPAGAY
jgi:hypothetical protein